MFKNKSQFSIPTSIRNMNPANPNPYRLPEDPVWLSKSTSNNCT